jgi:hypothetical protein
LYEVQVVHTDTVAPAPMSCPAPAISMRQGLY